jgi:hypothetical protein
MSRLLVLPLSLLALLVPGAFADEPKAPAPGLYVVDPGNRGPMVALADGSRVSVGRPWPGAVREASLVSRDNANRAFDLRLSVPYLAGEERPAGQVLVLPGGAHLTQGGGASGTEISYLQFRLPAGPAIGEAADLYGVKAHVRRHPGHRLRVEFVVPDAPFEAGGPMEVELRIENVGTETVAFVRGGQQRGARDGQFSFVARGGPGSKAAPDVGDANNFGGIAGLVHLAPGETHAQKIDLAKWFRLEAGTWFLLGTYELEFHEPTKERWGPPLWADYATAPFMVVVK